MWGRFLVLCFMVGILSPSIATAFIEIGASNTDQGVVIEIDTPAGNVSTFLDLTDTPASYAGQSGNCIKVDGGETSLIFGACDSGGGITWANAINGTLYLSENPFGFYNSTDFSISDYYNKTEGQNVYLNLSGENANQNIDISPYNFSTNARIFAAFIGSTLEVVGNIFTLNLTSYGLIDALDIHADDWSNVSITHLQVTDFNDTVESFGYYNQEDFNITDYYLLSNPFGYYNSTNPSPDTNWTASINITHFSNTNGNLTLVMSFLATWWEQLWGAKTTDDLPQGSTNFYDNQSWNQSLADSIYSTGPHTVDTNASNCADDGDVLLGSGECQDLNATIDSRTAGETFLASNVTVTTGTLDSGNLTSIQFLNDGDTLNVSEVAGSNPLTIIVNYTNVSTFNSILLNSYYQGGLGHEIEVQLFNYNSGLWELKSEITDMSGFSEAVIPVFDPANHINETNVSLRFIHIQNGNPSHEFFLDFVALQRGTSTITTNQHDALSGRDETTNHPWALDRNGSKALTNNWDQGAFNLTNAASWFLGIVNASSILNAPWITSNCSVSGSCSEIVYVGVETEGSINITEGNLTISGGDINVTNGNIIVESGNITIKEDFFICLNEGCTRWIKSNSSGVFIQG